jgi:hypothetical protein
MLLLPYLRVIMHFIEKIKPVTSEACAPIPEVGTDSEPTTGAAAHEEDQEIWLYDGEALVLLFCSGRSP